MRTRRASYPRVRIGSGGHGGLPGRGCAAGRDRPHERPGYRGIGGARALATHDPGKLLLDVALAVALGGDCLAGAGMLRAKPDVVRPVASDPTVSRLIDSLAAAAPMALDAVRAARPYAREYVWKLAPNEASGGGG